jgi:hypothetical protein
VANTADDADFDDQPRQRDGQEHGADEPGDAGGDGAQDLVHAARVTVEHNLIVAHRRRHLVGEFDRGVVTFYRQLANQAREQERRFLDDLVLAAQL